MDFFSGFTFCLFIIKPAQLIRIAEGLLGARKATKNHMKFTTSAAIHIPVIPTE